MPIVGIHVALAVLLPWSNPQASTSGADDAAEVLRRSAAAIVAARSFTYSATREPGGVLAGQLPTVHGEVLIARIKDADALGARIWTVGQLQIPGTKEPVPFVNAYDGSRFRSLRAKDRLLIEGVPEEGGRSLFSDGADGVLLEPLVDRVPFARELAGTPTLRGDSEVDGVHCTVVEVEMPPSLSYHRARWYIAQDDHLPRRVEMLYAFGKEEGAQTTSASHLVLGATLTDDSFGIALPEGFARKTMEQTNSLLEIGAAAPEWELRDPAGASHRLADLKGRVVVLDFWATWCGPCRAAMPAIQRVHERFQEQRVAVFGVDFKDRGDAAGYMREKSFTYTLLLDGDATGERYGVVGIPVFYVIGVDGKVAYRHRGSGEGLESELVAAIESALAAAKQRRRVTPPRHASSKSRSTRRRPRPAPGA